MSRPFYGDVFICLLLFCSNSFAESFSNVRCPPMPTAITEVYRDVTSDIKAKVGALGPVKIGEIGVRTEVIAKNLFKENPNLDKMFALQTMSATYCEMLNQSKLDDREKINRWEKFQEKVLNLKSEPALQPMKSREKASNHSEQKNAVSLPPIFTVHTEKDLKLYVDSKSQISADREKNDRLNVLEIYNQCKIPIHNLEIFTQFPEAIAEIHSDSESGSDYKASPVWDEWSVHVGADNESPKLSIHQPKTGLWKIVISTLPALTRVKIDLITTVGEEADAYVGGMQWPLEISKKEGLFSWLFYGTYQFQQGQTMETSRFSVPLKYTPQKRLIETLPLIVGGFKDGTWLKFMFMPAIVTGNAEYGGTMVFSRGTSSDFRSSVRPEGLLLKNSK